MPTPDELSGLQDLEQRLRYSKPQTRPLSPAFKYQLRAALLAQERPARRATAPRFKSVAFAATVVSLCLLVMIFTPAGQIIADALLRFGPFTLTDAPSAAERAVTATPDATYQLRTKTVPLAEADTQTDFTVLYPHYLPAEYAPPAPPTVELVYNQQGKVSSVQVMLFSRKGQQILYYTQTPYTPDPNRSPFEMGIGEAQATPLMVGDGEGVWLEDFNWGVEANDTPVPYNVLIWQMVTPADETFLFWLGSQERLPLDEMMRIAASVGPAADGPTNTINSPFGDVITLRGFDITETELSLYWQANDIVETELTAFVHWHDAAGMLVAQVDRSYPADHWVPGQTIIETYNLHQPALPPGRYSLVVGLYRPDTGARLPVQGQSKAEVQLTEIEIKDMSGSGQVTP